VLLGNRRSQQDSATIAAATIVAITIVAITIVFNTHQKKRDFNNSQNLVL
jgi:hypothetical protein